MAKKSLGYVELEWTCPNCSTKNPGSQKTCLSCGMPQPNDIQFEQPAQEKIIEDEQKLAEAKAGPDVHCYYCGSRNAATATACTQCGADLSVGAKRSSGRVMGAHRDKPAAPVACPSCGAENDASAPKCVQCGSSLVDTTPQPESKPAPVPAKAKSKGMGLLGKIGLVALVLAFCAAGIVFVVLYNRTEDLNGTVENVSWHREIVIEQLVPVSYEAWHDEIPNEAEIGDCSAKVRRTQDQPTENSREVCGTPYTVDSGSGYGEVVQDCKYEVYEDFCEYTVEEWREANTQRLSGNDFSPNWPALSLATNQREGQRSETFTCHFKTEDGNYSYSTGNFNMYKACKIGSQWVLQVNTFNMVTDVEPQ